MGQSNQEVAAGVQNTVHLQIKGLIRFSYPATSGFQINEKPLDAVMAELWDPRRMAERFEMFEYFALRSIRMQTDQKFTTGILIGKDMPEAYLLRLLNLTEKLERVTIIPMEPATNTVATRECFRQIKTLKRTSHVATFRLDDDDGLHKDAVARIRDIAGQVIPLQPHMPFGIAFNRGYFLDLSAPVGEPRVTEVNENLPLGIGLTLVAPARSQMNCFSQNHRKLYQSFTTYADQSRPMFIRTVHASNDSGAIASGLRKVPEPEAAEKILSEGFGLSLRELEAG